MSKVRIDPEIESLLPVLRPEEFAILEKKLKAEGCREKFTAGQYPGSDGPIQIDGHNRRRICAKHKIPYAFGRVLKFDSRQALKDWAIEHALGRRNITDEHAAFLRGIEYTAKKNELGVRKSAGAQSGQSDHSGEDESAKSTAEELAEKHGVSEKTIRRDADFADAVIAIGKKSKKRMKEILSGESGLSRDEVIAEAAMIGQKKGKTKPPRKEPGEPLTYEGKYDKIVQAFTNMSALITKAINEDDGEKLREYLGYFKLVVYSSEVIEDGVRKAKKPKFRGFPGLRRVVKLAAAPGKIKTQAEIKKEFQEGNKEDE